MPELFYHPDLGLVEVPTVAPKCECYDEETDVLIRCSTSN